MTKIDIFSGFLGAGKTTLIKKLIKEAFAGQQVVLIENEFGEIGIGGVSLDKDHGRQVGVVGIGEVSGLETLGRDLDGCHDDIKIALGKGGGSSSPHRHA